MGGATRGSNDTTPFNTLSPEAENIILRAFDLPVIVSPEILNPSVPVDASVADSSGNFPSVSTPSAPAATPTATPTVLTPTPEIEAQGRSQDSSLRGRRRAIRGGANPTILTSPIGFFEDQTNPRKSLLGL